MSEFRSVVIRGSVLASIILCLFTTACTNRPLSYFSPIIGYRANIYREPGGPPKIVSKMESLQFSGFADIQRHHTIKLMNASQKIITAFKVSWISGGMRHDMLMSNKNLQPGKETTLMPFTKTMFIDFVMFEDGTFEGDSEIVNEIKVSRSGHAKQLTALQDSLQQLIDKEKEISIDQFKSIVTDSTIHEIVEEKYQAYFDSGTSEARHMAISMFDSILQIESENRLFSFLYKEKLQNLTRDQIIQIKENLKRMENDYSHVSRS